MKIVPVAPALGAEIHDVDLSADLGSETITALRAALLDHLVIFFRDQALTPDQLVSLARRFGEIGFYPFVEGMPGHPEIVEVVKREDEKINFGGLWHSDTTYLERPPLGSLLYALEVPPIGGDTLFSNMYMAYDALSDALRDLLAPLRAVNSAEKASAKATRQDRMREHGRQANVVTTSVHPVVRTHPETGRPALYVNGGHTVCFDGMSVAESAPLLDYLYSVQQRPEFTCRFAWRPGSVAFWDNRACQHNAINDYHGKRRTMWRVTLQGDVPA